jgi:hypothetical protein
VNEIDCLIAGIGGGILGAGAVLFTAQFHWKRLTRDYQDAKQHFQDSIRILDLQDRVKKIEEFLYLSLQYSRPFNYASDSELKEAGDKAINKYKQSINNLKDR